MQVELPWAAKAVRIAGKHPYEIQISDLERRIYEADWHSYLKRYTLKKSKYFRIGENKLRRLAEENKNANWLIMNGNRIQIKRKQFEKL